MYVDMYNNLERYMEQRKSNVYEEACFIRVWRGHVFFDVHEKGKWEMKSSTNSF